MKRSPAPSCSSSSSSSCVGSVIPHQSEKPKAKAKRAKKNHNPEKCQNGNSSAGSARRSSIYRGVTRHRWTGRYEAHLWDKSSWNNIQNKKGRQVYLGAYDNEEAAAHTYDLAALKYWGPGTTLNFPIETYTKELEEMQKVTKEEYLASLRRRSSGFSRGVSKYRGVARHHHNGRWEARIGRVFGNKYLYLGTYNTQEEAAAAYDMAAIEYRGANAVTNFDISNYIDRMKKKIPGFNAQSSTVLDAALPNNCHTQSKVDVDNCQPKSKVDVEVEQQQQQKQEKQEVVGLEEQLQYNINAQLPPCMDTTSTMVGMEPSSEQEEDPWSFLDNVPDLPIEKPCELNDLFDHTGFEDDIDFIFEAAAAAAVTHQDVVDVKMDGILDDISGFDETLKVVGVSRSLDNMIGQERLLSSSSSSSSSSAISSPSSSTTTSVSCIYSA